MKVAAVLVASIVVLALFGVVGRWEGTRAVDRNAQAMSSLYARAAPAGLMTKTLSGYRVGALDCLFYQAGRAPYAYEFCFDRSGRLVEAADRVGGGTRYWSLAWVPERAPAVVGGRDLAKTLHEVERASR